MINKAHIKIGDVVFGSSDSVDIMYDENTNVYDKITNMSKEVDTKLSGKANTSHGNHVPTTETANNAKFLRNDNTWQTVTPANIGAAAITHTHDYLPLSGGTLTGNLTAKRIDSTDQYLTGS